MSEAPLAPACRHCGATNDSGASECWLCQRRDWREDPKVPSKNSPSQLTVENRSRLAGCMVVITITLVALVGLSFRAGRIVGVVVAIVGVLVYAVALALFTICMAIS
jgi:ribosomal protein L40E